MDAYDEAVLRLSRAGAVIQTFDNPKPYGELADTNGAITAVEAYYNHHQLYEDLNKKMDADVRARMLSGKQYTAHEYFGMREQRIQDMTAFAAQMKGFDVLITPTTIGRAPNVDDVDQNIGPVIIRGRLTTLKCAVFQCQLGWIIRGFRPAFKLLAGPMMNTQYCKLVLR